MATELATIIADFQTQLAIELAVGGTSFSIQSNKDDDGVTLPNGQYYFTLDGGNSSKEHIICTLTGTSATSVQSVSRQGVMTSGAVRKHRVGATVTITDFRHIKAMSDLLAGTTPFNGSVPLKYDTDPTITNDKEFATKKYVDDVAISGAPDASTTVKGISKLSTAPVSSTNPIAVGDNDPRVPTQGENDALVGTSGTPSTSNPFATKATTDYKISQSGTEIYATAGGTANALTLTLSPAPSAYTAGMKVSFKASATNTGATTINVNGLGVKDIKKSVTNNLTSGDIVTNGVYEITYDGTNFQINSSALSIANQKVIGSSVLTAINSSSITTTVITHGLGVIPRVIRLTASRSYGANNLGTLSYGMAVVNTSGTVTFQKTHTQTTQSGGSSQTYFDGSGIAIIAGATSQSATLTIGTITSTQMTITCPAVGFGTISTGADINTIWEVEA